MSEEDSIPPARLWRERLYSTVAVSLFLLLAAGLGLILLFEVPFRLLCGWAVHAWVTLPPLFARWNELLLPAAALGLALFLTDRFVRWALAAKGSKLPWRGRHTVAATFLLLLGAAAAIAMSGIVHQMVWLGAEPWWGNGRGMQQTIALDKTRQIAVAIREFEQRNDRYPESLAELDLPRDLLLVPSRERGVAEPFVYLKPADARKADAGLAVVVSPVLPDRGRVAVGHLSGDAILVQADQLPDLLTRPLSKDHE